MFFSNPRFYLPVLPSMVLSSNLDSDIKLNYFKKQQKLFLTFPYLRLILTSLNINTGSNWPGVLNRLVP